MKKLRKTRYSVEMVDLWVEEEGEGAGMGKAVVRLRLEMRMRMDGGKGRSCIVVS